VPEQSLRDAKALMVRRISLSESEVRAIADGYLDRFDLGLPMDEQIHAAKRYIEATPQEVRSAFRKWLRPDDLVRVTQGPPPQ